MAKYHYEPRGHEYKVSAAVKVRIFLPKEGFDGLDQVMKPDLGEKIKSAEVSVSSSDGFLEVYISSRDIVGARASLASVARQAVLFRRIREEVT
jgi:hypothetical protein